MDGLNVVRVINVASCQNVGPKKEQENVTTRAQLMVAEIAKDQALSLKNVLVLYLLSKDVSPTLCHCLLLFTAVCHCLPLIPPQC